MFTFLFPDSTLEDFETFDNTGPGGASGTAKELLLSYGKVLETAGNYTLTATLSNEISNYTVITEVRHD